MSIKPQFSVIPKLSIRPDSIVFYNKFEHHSATAREKKADIQPLSAVPDVPSGHWVYDLFNAPVWVPHPSALFVSSMSQNVDNCPHEKEHKLPAFNTHNFELSHKASRRVKEKVTWLYHLAKNRTITTTSGKVLSSFRMSFITLTLPALQKHSSSDITSLCINQFLTECKERFGLVNYVWRLEFQENGNAHYHLATDVFMEYYQARSIWNRCVGKLGYVSDYADKFSKMSFSEYCSTYKAEDKTSFETKRTRYAYGRASRWLNPNTVDVRVVTGSKNIAWYISKYITKGKGEPLNPIVAKREPSDTNLRLWFCSRSLSKVDKISVPLEAISDLLRDCLAELKEVKAIIHDYVEVWYFNMKEQLPVIQMKFRTILWDYARSRGYWKDPGGVKNYRLSA